MLTLQPIKAFKDNYIWALINESHKTLCVVDPGDAKPVIDFIEKSQLTLTTILITHHHNDHCGGVKTLREKYNLLVYGPNHKDILATHIVVGGDKFFPDHMGLSFEVIAIPGHTLEHVAYYSREENLLFSGDTLFSAGCGRVFEGTMEQMLHSLHKLKALPDSTKVYCGHEYTLQNLRFAEAVEKSNQDIKNHISVVQASYDKGQPSLPSTIALEKKTNPFLRTDIQEVVTSASAHGNRSLRNPVEVFTEIREWKNGF